MDPILLRRYARIHLKMFTYDTPALGFLRLCASDQSSGINVPVVSSFFEVWIGSFTLI